MISTSESPQDDPVQDLAELLSRHVIPLYRQPHGKRPEHVGTAFLLTALGRSFLATAGHVLAEPRGMFFYVEKHTKRTLTGQLVRSKAKPGEQADPWDIAILLLTGPGLPPYPGVDKASAEADFFIGNPKASLEGEHFLITGMPASRTKANPHTHQLKVEGFSLVSSNAPTATYKAVRRDPDKHLVMELDRKGSVGADGSLRMFPDPHGMSGSPVWCLPSESNGLESVQLVGILTEFHEDLNALVATRVEPMLELIGRTVAAVAGSGV